MTFLVVDVAITESEFEIQLLDSRGEIEGKD